MNANLGRELDDLSAALAQSLVPTHIHGGIWRYVVEGILPGDFLRAVLDNNLTRAFGCADDRNTEHMHDIVKFMYNEVPSMCWGTPKRVDDWCLHKGLSGLPENQDAQPQGDGQ